MKIFSPMYERCLRWAQHRHAVYYLSGMSVAESIFFPIPVDVMLAPMALAKREKAFFYAFVCTLTSVVGGVIGYFLGYWAFDSLVMPVLESTGYITRYDEVVKWFEEYGVWVVFIAGFSPIPYKLFTVSAGALHMALLPFLVASMIGRASRFFLVSAMMYYGGDAIDRKLKQTIDWLGWVVIFLAVAGYLIYKYI
ncbi:YqaA family protein [Pleionea sp. CnH1-48]|uniref:YqaA family protein n=1 Tax=Pleionea sp. CnH1-48 TaxID=2954494 RepID=UPI0020968116|nr:YqaA family protein [Pleionea sp. CnH1-48]MCO7226372.1 DedA family protein [Pleionea sp. CnH1-48]